MDRRISIDRRVGTQDDKFGAAAHNWQLVATVWAERKDVAPGRGEVLQQQLEQGMTRTRYRFRWRGDIDSSMRIREGDRTFQIVDGPAELGRRLFVELICVEYATTGGAAANGP